MCCLAQSTFALKLVSKNITSGPVEVGIIMTGLGYGLEPPYVRRTDILLVFINEPNLTCFKFQRKMINTL